MAMDVCKKNQIQKIVVGAQHITSAYKQMFFLRFAPMLLHVFPARWGVGVGEVL